MFIGSAYSSSSLSDKLTDAGTHVPGGRIDYFWSRVKVQSHKIKIPGDTLEFPYLYVPNLGLEHFKLHSIEFGNWLNEQERRNQFYASMLSFTHLADVLNISEKQVGMNGFLGIALGARGKSKALAHYEPLPYCIINLTKEKGAGALAHEYGHAIDNVIAYHNGANGYLSGGESTRNTVSKSVTPDTKFQYLFEKVFEAVYYNEQGEQSEFCKNLFDDSKLLRNRKYYRSRVEVWARVFEMWVAYHLHKKNIKNGFLAEAYNLYKRREVIYPSEADIERADSVIRALIAAVYELFAENAPQSENITESDSARQQTKLQTVDGEIPARYEIVELDSLIPSHDPETWKAREDYPARCQQRDYTIDITEQQKVVNGAKNFKPEFLVTTVPTSTDGTPVVARWENQNAVLGGNGRTMMLITLRNRNKFSIYAEYLENHASDFGYSKKDVRAKKYPVVVRVIEADPAQCAYYSNVLNKSMTQGIDTTTEAVSLARQLTPELLESIAEIIDNADVETTAQLWQNVKASRALISTLRKARIITNQNQNQFVDKYGDPDDQGKFKIERIFLAAILEDSDTINSARNYTLQILKTAPALLKLKKLSAEYNITPKIKEAINLEYERRAAGMPKKDFIKQVSFERPEGIVGTVIDVWNMLDSGARRFKEFITKYSDAALKEDGETEGFSFREKLTADALIKQFAGGTDSPQLQGVQTAKASTLRNANYKAINLYELSDFLGDRIPRNFSATVQGKKFNGKSSFVFQLADDLSANGKVLLNLAEEPIDSATVRERLDKTGVALRNVDLVHIRHLEELKELVETEQYSFIIIDSVQRMARFTPEQKILEWFLQNQGKYGFVFVLRMDKTGKFSQGKNDWGYDVDIEIEVENGVATLSKNRYHEGNPRTLNRKRYRIF